jgi:hypothetical protein
VNSAAHMNNTDSGAFKHRLMPHLAATLEQVSCAPWVPPATNDDARAPPLAHLSPPPIKDHHAAVEGPLLPFSPTPRNVAAVAHRRLAVDSAPIARFLSRRQPPKAAGAFAPVFIASDHLLRPPWLITRPPSSCCR